MKRFYLAIAVSILLLTVTSVRAYRSQEVLGVSIQPSDTVFPAVTSGPGFILPDSVLYGLDKFYQKVRLALVFTPENKAKLHAEIAGERLAELKVETSRNNQQGIDRALLELSQESMAAASDLRDASAQGKNVVQLARNTHQRLADYRGIINQVRAQVADSTYGQKLASVANVLWDAKLLSEDALPLEDVEHEIAANIEAEVEEAVLGVNSSTLRLEKKLSIFEKYASKAAEAKVKREQAQASKFALEDKRKDLILQRQKAIQEYLVKAQALRKQREQELAKLKQTIKELQAQLKQLQASSKSEQIGSQSGITQLKVTPSPKTN